MAGVGLSYFPHKGIFRDARHDARLHLMFDEAALRPEGSLPKKFLDDAALAGAYRLFDNPRVKHAQMIKAHRQKCIEQLEGYQGRLLLLHDTTVLDYSGLGIEELGQVGDGNGRGLYAHNSLAVIPGDRRVVGLMNQILHQRANVPRNESRAARQKRADRESRLWRDAVADLPPMPQGIQVIDISDRGSDISEYIDYEMKHGRHFIVRSQHNRKVAGENDQADKLHDLMRSMEAMFSYTMQTQGEKKRQARIGVAWRQVEVVPPRQKRGEHGCEPWKIWAVIARELDPPAGVEAIEWILLTNLPVACEADARRTIEDYASRWMIEDYHKAMKTGCGIEQVQLTSRHGLENFIGFTSVQAVHVLKLRNAARDPETADDLATVHENELMVRLAAKQTRHTDWKQMTVAEYFVAIARMGGYRANPKKRPPGWQTLWRGFIRLTIMAEGARLAKDV